MANPHAKQAAWTAHEALSASCLRDVTDAQLLPLLFTAARSLRSASSASDIVSSDYVNILLSSRFLRHDSADVRQLVGCLLCDAVRLHSVATAAGELAPSVSSLPFPESACDDVLRCVVFPFAEVVRTRDSLHRCELLIEAASASRVFTHVLPHCRSTDLAEQLQPLFDVVALADTSLNHTRRTGVGSSSHELSLSPVSEGVRGSDELSLTVASAMVRLLSDVLSTTQLITTAQLQPLVQALAQRSHALRRSAFVSGGGGSSLFANAAASPSTLIASRLLVSQADSIVSALCTYAMGFVDTGVQEIVAADVAGTGASTLSPGAVAGAASTSSAEEKRTGLRHVAKGLEVLVTVAELDPTLVSALVQALVPRLEHDSADVRLVVFRGFSGAVMANEAFFTTYPQAMAAVLACFQDTKSAVRLEAAQATRSWFDAAVALKWSHSSMEQLWLTVQPVLERALTDLHVHVRREAVMSLSHIALVAPSVVVVGGGADGATSSSPAPLPSWARALGLRTADKNGNVRRSAVACLCKLYREQLLRWVPDAVLNTVYAESGLFLAECYLEQLLPPPTKARSGSGRHSELSGAPTSMTQLHESSSALPLFDFEKESLREERGFVDALVQLCADVSPHHFTTLVSIMKKKAPLRTAIARLFELREEIKLKEDPKATEGQAIIHNIHRLLEFLQGVTRAEKGEWDTLFRSKDDRVAGAFLQVCADAQQAQLVNWHDERENLLQNLRGRLDTTTAAFVRSTLAPMMVFPVQLSHLEEIVRQLQETLAAVVTPRNAAASAASTRLPQQAHRVLGMLRALLLMLTTAPGLFAHASKALLEVLTLTARSLRSAHLFSPGRAAVAGSETEEALTLGFCAHGEWCLLALSCLKEWARYTAAAGALGDVIASGGSAQPKRGSKASVTPSSSSSSSSPSAATAGRRHPLVGVTEAMKKTALDTLTSMCLADLGPAFSSITGETASLGSTKRTAAPRRRRGAATSEPADATTVEGAAVDHHLALTAACHLSKEAARCFGALLAIPSFGNATDLRQLLDTLCERTQVSPPAHASSAAHACWLSALRSFLQDPQYTALLPTKALEQAFSRVLLGAIRPCTALPSPKDAALSVRGDDVDRLKVSAFFAVSTPRSLPRLALPLTVRTAVIDKAAKALTALTQSQPGDRRSVVASHTLDTLLQAHKRSCGEDGKLAAATAPTGPAPLSRIGACQTRLAIDKQLAKLLVTPSSDIAKELAVSVLLSAEGEECVREPVQRKLANTITAAGSRTDMRYVALLILTAMSEDNRQSFLRLRGLVQTVGSHFYQKQATSGVSLSSPQALFCYLEYTIPFLVLFLAHHTYYERERTTHFILFQRVWHLLFEELFRCGTQCVSFVSALLSRIKQADDVLDRTSDRHRVLCDLASRVVLERLGQRQAGVESVKRYPGVVLLPNFFANSSRPNAQAMLSTVYLDDSVRVFANAVFRAPPSSKPSTGANQSEGVPAVPGVMDSRHASPSATPRASVERAATAAGVSRRVRGTVSVAASSDDMDAEPRDVTPYGQLDTTPGSSTRKRPLSPTPGRDNSPPATRARVETDGKGAPRAAVQDALNELVHGLRKSEIAAMRWKTVRTHIEQSLDAATLADETARTALVEYAKELLKQHYTDAPA